MNNQNEDSPKFPPARPEITAEVVAIDCLLADLLLKCQGNARELDALFDVLDNHLWSCEQARDTLLGIEENERQALTMTDLPMSEQAMIFGAGLFGAYLLEVVGIMTKTNPTVLGEKIARQVSLAVADTSHEQITDTLKEYLRKHKEAVKEYQNNLIVQLQKENN